MRNLFVWLFCMQLFWRDGSGVVSSIRWILFVFCSVLFLGSGICLSMGARFSSEIIAVAQVLPHQARACQEAEAEPPCAVLDSTEDGQHHPVSIFCSFMCRRSLDVMLISGARFR
jgi:hypothetical protein